MRQQARAQLFGVASEPVTVGRFEVARRIGAGAMGEGIAVALRKLARPSLRPCTGVAGPGGSRYPTQRLSSTSTPRLAVGIVASAWAWLQEHPAGY